MFIHVYMFIFSHHCGVISTDSLDLFICSAVSYTLSRVGFAVTHLIHVLRSSLIGMRHDWCVMAFQHYLSMFFATLTVPFLLSQAICMNEDNVGKAEIIGTLFTASGVITLLQTAVGCRYVA